MRNPDYDAAALAETLAPTVREAEFAVSKASVLAEKLVATGDAYDIYAHDHAAETLENVAARLEAAAARLRSLTAYTNYPPAPVAG